MEADWEVEIGGDAPVIDADWSGYVDLRQAPECVRELPEVIEFPPVGPVLAALNAPDSRFFTVKCDVWPVDEIDPIEFDAPRESAVHAFACYIDIVQRDPQLWTDPQSAIAWCKKVCSVLHSSTLPCSRIDLIVRRVHSSQHQAANGITAYVAACGPTPQSAKAQLALALKMLTACVHRTDQAAQSR